MFGFYDEGNRPKVKWVVGGLHRCVPRDMMEVSIYPATTSSLVNVEVNDYIFTCCIPYIYILENDPKG